MVKLNLTQVHKQLKFVDLTGVNLSLALFEVFRNSKSTIINSYDMVNAQDVPFFPHSPIIDIPKDFVDNKNSFFDAKFSDLINKFNFEELISEEPSCPITALANLDFKHLREEFTNVDEKAFHFLHFLNTSPTHPGQWNNFVKGVVSHDLHVDHLPKNTPLPKVDRGLGFLLFDIIKKGNCIKNKL